MPIDTAAKRRSAVATRRLPWFRRFANPAADSSVSQADRQQLAFVYGGLLSIGVIEGPYYIDAAVGFVAGSEMYCSFSAGPAVLGTFAAGLAQGGGFAAGAVALGTFAAGAEAAVGVPG